MKDICNFMPVKEYDGEVKYFCFVYETGLRRLVQPFFHSGYRAVLVAKGSGVLKIDDREYPLEAGTLFFTFPYRSYEIEGTNNFTYLYIAFDGPGAKKLLDGVDIGPDRMIFHNLGNLYEFWMGAIRRMTRINANMLTESVLLYTLSFVNVPENSHILAGEDRFECILEYIDSNFTDPALSLKRVATLFFYSEKYLSALFSKKMKMKFTDYLNNIRIQYALKLLEKKPYSVRSLSAACGYNDAFYFSKVFKKIVGRTPTEYMKEEK